MRTLETPTPSLVDRARLIVRSWGKMYGEAAVVVVAVADPIQSGLESWQTARADMLLQATQAQQAVEQALTTVADSANSALGAVVEQTTGLSTADIHAITESAAQKGSAKDIQSASGSADVAPIAQPSSSKRSEDDQIDWFGAIATGVALGFPLSALVKTTISAASGEAPQAVAQPLSRRDFLRLAASSTGALILAGCASAPTSSQQPKVQTTHPTPQVEPLSGNIERPPDTAIKPTNTPPPTEKPTNPPPATATKPPEATATPRPNILGLKPLSEAALSDMQIVSNPENKYVDRNYQIFGDHFRPFTVFKSAYYDGNDVIVIVNFYDKQTNQFHRDRRVRFANKKGKGLFFPGEFDIESLYAGTVVNIAFIGIEQFNIFNSNSDQSAEAVNGALHTNQIIVEFSPKK